MTAIVIDNGSGSLKAGFAGKNVPQAIFPSFIGCLDSERSRRRLINVSPMPRERYIGAEAQKLRGILALHYPIDHAIITDWSAMEAIWEYAFCDILKTAPDEHDLLITVNPLVPKKQHINICESMLELFGVSSIHLANNGILAMTAANCSTGVVVDCGDSVSYAMPVIDGRVLSDSVMLMNYGGRDLALRLGKLIASEVGVNLGDSSGKREIAREIKEKICFVSLNYARDIRNAAKFREIYHLPDMSKVTICEERFQCPEALFRPSLAGREEEGIHALACDAINKASYQNEERRHLLFGNVILSGGTTCFEGFSGRLAIELQKRRCEGIGVKVTAPVERKYLAWLGGSAVAASPDCEWLTKTDYEEYGPPVVFRKFVLP